MLPDESQPVDEKKILTAQYIAFAMMFVLFIFLSSVTTSQIAISIATLPMLFIGFSSIKHEISILRPKGRRGHSYGKPAVTFGKIAIISYFVSVALTFVIL